MGAGNKRRLAGVLVCLLLLSLGGCATDRWCNELNDYTTLEADLDHCERKAGFWGQVIPGRVDNCMKSLGWRPCQVHTGEDQAP
ncbi:MAG: hypothetical protein KJ720_01160 [Proteobacteria bacterium]|nr:hypothetical protein [Pseudomonadota bacterium]MBU1452607.1 hypothetical protein [Pseudomonadota bacterium]MBU2468747.1 hypothetical protein [Pseudomonadota bacterium]MBU2519326.1 hypothetical protein [Pseudomonadota bacterium]